MSTYAAFHPEDPRFLRPTNGGHTAIFAIWSYGSRLPLQELHLPPVARQPPSRKVRGASDSMQMVSSQPLTYESGPHRRSSMFGFRPMPITGTAGCLATCLHLSWIEPEVRHEVPVERVVDSAFGFARARRTPDGEGARVNGGTEVLGGVNSVDLRVPRAPLATSARDAGPVDSRSPWGFKSAGRIGPVRDWVVCGLVGYAVSGIPFAHFKVEERNGHKRGLSSVAKCYDPPRTNSWQRYDWIRDNLAASWRRHYGFGARIHDSIPFSDHLMLRML